MKEKKRCCQPGERGSEEGREARTGAVECAQVCAGVTTKLNMFYLEPALTQVN